MAGNGEPVDVEDTLRDELSRGDRMLSGIGPVLSHLLSYRGHALVTDAVVSRVRGMLNDIADQLLRSFFNAGGEYPASGFEPLEHLADQLAQDSALLVHMHSVAMEAVLTERLDQRASVDQVLTPLWQELIASEQPLIGEMAMKAMTAQSRFIQSQRRMSYAMNDLPPEMLERTLRIWARVIPMQQEAIATEALQAIRARYDEGYARNGQLSRLISALRGAAIGALDIEHSGVALFVTALAHLSGQSREKAVFACHDRQTARLALSLRAAGLDAAGVDRQLLVLEPTDRLPVGVAEMSQQAAIELLRQSEVHAELQAAG